MEAFVQRHLLEAASWGHDVTMERAAVTKHVIGARAVCSCGYATSPQSKPARAMLLMLSHVGDVVGDKAFTDWAEKRAGAARARSQRPGVSRSGRRQGPAVA